MSNEYLTKNIGEAASLISKNIKLIRIDRQNDVCFFVFDQKQNCEKLSKEFFFGELLVNAREFFEAEKRLKQLIFTK
jgi:hypothetical protein